MALSPADKNFARRPRPWLDRRRQVRARIPLLLLCATLAIGTCGCWLAAIQLAPLAIGAVEGVGSAVANVAEGAVVAAHKGSGQSGDEDHPDEDEMTREDRCEQLQMEAPGVIELRKGAAGAPEYRDLQLSGSLDRPQWSVMTDKDTNAGGWRSAAHLLAANFTPPLGALPGAGSEYLAYRTVQSDSLTAVEAVVPLSLNFSAGAGTFNWKGQLYQFALAHKLPCFPPPPS